MSLLNKFKEMFNGGCIKEESVKYRIETIHEALAMIKTLRGTNLEVIGGKVNALLDQYAHWIDILQQDMNIVKGMKLREISADLTGLKNQISMISQDLKAMKERCCDKETKELVDRVVKVTKSIKDKKSKEI